MPIRRTFTAILAGLTLLASAALAQAEPVHVFAAASLKTALDEVSAAWKASTGRETANTYAASSALAKQIEAGAPAELFISADLDWMMYLSDRNLTVRDSETRLLGNSLVLVAPADSPAAVTIVQGFDLEALLGDGRLAMGETRSVPAGKYGRAALEKLGVWDKVAARIAQSENVRAALKLVATGEAAAGIVYATDAAAEPAVKVLAVFPEDSHPAIVYPAALVAGSRNPDAAAFLAFLKSPEAAAIFRKAGFRPLTGG